MAPSPLVEAVEHFSLAQLIADTNLCRNVLNDVGAQPAEVFLLVAALEARIPQTLMEHTATNDLSVVEPRLVAELSQRGVERSRAEWAVNAWKEVVGGSSLGQPTVMRDSTPATVRPSEPGFGARPSDPFTSDAATVRPSEPGAAARASEPVLPARPSEPAGPQHPVVHASTVPAGNGKPRRTGIIVAAVVVAALVIAGVAILLTRSSGKHSTAGSSSPRSSGSSSSAAGASSTAATGASSSGAAPSTGGASPAANLNAPLGAPKQLPVAATAAWSDTGLTVVKGERINIVTTGQIAPGPGQSCGPDGLPGTGLDIFSLIGGGHTAAVIGLIAGSGTPFLVGSNYNGVASASGHLYLGINDVGVDNNSGSFTTTIRLQQS
jgi:hypothetical protein